MQVCVKARALKFSNKLIERKETEVTALLALLGALLVALGAGLSVFWFGRVA